MDELKTEMRELNAKLLSVHKKLVSMAEGLIDEEVFSDAYTATRLFEASNSLRYVVSDAAWQKKYREQESKEASYASCKIGDVSFASFRVGEKVESADKVFECDKLKIVVKDGEIKEVRV